MTWTFHKPRWRDVIGGTIMISPAATLVLADWWDAWRLMWMSIAATHADKTTGRGHIHWGRGLTATHCVVCGVSL